MSDFDKVLSNSLDYLKNSEIKEACKYALNSGGKRIRPAILFAVIQSYRNDANKGLNAAIGIEMIHTYSLIHDDLPAMDNDDLRRGKPTVHIKYGEAIAILAGDTLLSEGLSYLNNSCDNNNSNHLILDEAIKSIGGNGMIYGQELDILNESNEKIDISLLNTINNYKTAKLLTLPMLCGAIITNNIGDCKVWKQIGEKIGLLFQIQDDILDKTSDEETLGKSVNSDEKNNKITYVDLLGIDKCNQKIQELYNDAIELLDTLMIDSMPIKKVFEAILNREK